MKTETKRCDDCNERIIILTFGEGAITVTTYQGVKLLHSNGNGEASTARRHRVEQTFDVIAEALDGGLPNVSTECRCRVREVSLAQEIADLLRR
ncbi:MAG: hypothetical protein WAO40_04950 [Candidatus Nanopelagicales bacterium]